MISFLSVVSFAKPIIPKASSWLFFISQFTPSIRTLSRYNLSINDNGVIVKNMLSTNYSPTYFVNNVFIYDGSKLDYFHDEVFKDTVYFFNNIFYNTSTTTPTTWYRRNNALDKAVFSSNAFYEAGGTYSEIQPYDKHGVEGNPLFVGNPLSYNKDGIGVENIIQVAEQFKLQSDSPLIDAGHWSPASGIKDFFSTHLYYGQEVDIGLHESIIGVKVDNPVEKELDLLPDGVVERVNLALNKPIIANYTHPAAAGYYAARLVDGDKTTRWACSDPDQMNYPILITLDFEEEIIFNEIFLDEYTDHSTNLRIENFELRRWEAETQNWVTFCSVTGGMGRDRVLEDFGNIISSKLQLAITKQFSSEYWTPSMTEIQVYYEPDEVVEDHNPEIVANVSLFDKTASMTNNHNNNIGIELIPDGDIVNSIEYYGPEGNKLRELYENDHYTIDGDIYNLSKTFLATLNIGKCKILFTMKSGTELSFYINVVDTTELAARISQADGYTIGNTPAGEALIVVLEEAKLVLSKANRSTTAIGNDLLDQTIVDEADYNLEIAILAFEQELEYETEPTPEPTNPEPDSTQPTQPAKPEPTTKPTDLTDPGAQPIDLTEPTTQPTTPSIPAPTQEISENEVEMTVEAQDGLQAVAKMQEDAFSEDVTLRIRRISNDSEEFRSAIATLNSAISGIEQLFLIDIQAITASGASVQPIDGKTVSITMPIPEGFDPARIAVAHIKSSGAVEILRATVKDGMVTFITDSFSTFAIIEIAASIPASGETVKTGESSPANVYLILLGTLLMIVVGYKLYIVRKQKMAIAMDNND